MSDIRTIKNGFQRRWGSKRRKAAEGELVMNEPKSLAEWLESEGNPKYHIAEGENGSMAIAIESKKTLNPGSITVFNFKETVSPNGHKHFWISSGWGIRRECLKAIRGLLNNELAERFNEPEIEASKDSFSKYEVCIWVTGDDERENGEISDIFEALSDTHAQYIIRERMIRGKYPKEGTSFSFHKVVSA